MNVHIREAHLTDIAAVRNLAVDSVTYGIPHTRDVDSASVRARTRDSLAQLELTVHLQKEFKILVAEDIASHQIIGYVMLDMARIEPSTGEPQCFIHDIAVRRDWWGRFVVHRLVRAASELTAGRGLKYLVGEVSVANERTVGTALKQFGFEIERHQIVKRIHRADSPRE